MTPQIAVAISKVRSLNWIGRSVDSSMRAIIIGLASSTKHVVIRIGLSGCVDITICTNSGQLCFETILTFLERKQTRS